MCTHGLSRDDEESRSEPQVIEIKGALINAKQCLYGPDYNILLNSAPDCQFVNNGSIVSVGLKISTSRFFPIWFSAKHLTRNNASKNVQFGLAPLWDGPSIASDMIFIATDT